MNWTTLAAQCVMCYRTAAAQQAERSRIFNSGIIILLIPPLLILAGVVLLAWHKSGSPAKRAAITKQSPPEEILY